MELLVNAVLRAGGLRRRLGAKVFGGAHILDGVAENLSPGIKNAEFVMQYLEMENIPVVSSDVGGYSARRIYRRTDTGEVLLRRVPRFSSKSVAERERAHGKELKTSLRKPGSITRFDR